MTARKDDPAPTSSAPRGRRLHRTGAVVFWIALPCLFLSAGAASVFTQWTLLALNLSLTAVVFLGLALMHWGRKLMAIRGEQLLVDDPRPPVVYLRPFAADASGSSVATRFLGFRYFTEEEQLAMVMNELGPFVAIGDPRESVADLGAGRVYVGDEAWQTKVSELVSRARLVVLRAGTSEGFWWEFRTVRALVPPERLLLLVPSDQAEYAAFRERAGEVLRHVLPEVGGKARILGEIGGIIEFDSDWRGQPLPEVRSFARASFTAPYVARLKLTLKPVFERLGATWSRPAIARGRLAVLVALGIVFVPAAAVWILLKLPDWTYRPEPYTPPSTGEQAVALPEKSPYELAFDAQVARFDRTPDIVEAMRGVKSGQEARARARDLSRRGLVRLSDDQLGKRAVLLSRLIAIADVSTCASMVKGTPAPGLEQALRQLTAHEIEQYFEIVFESTVAEVRLLQGPSHPSQAQVDRAFQTFLDRLPKAHGDLIISVLDSPGQAGDESACSAGRVLYSNLIQLPESHRAILTRALVMP